MLRRISQILTGGVALTLWFLKESITAWFFDKVIHTAEPRITALNFVEYGPPVAFAILCIGLIVWDINNSRTKQKGQTSQRDTALHTLVKLRSEGVVIRNKANELLFTSHLDAWTGEVINWMNQVINSLKQVDEADAEWFSILDTVPPARVPVPNIRLGGDTDRATFISIFRQHDYRLKRLDDLLKKHGVGAG